MDTPLTPEELDHHYVIGIDLGTTNSAVAYALVEPQEPAAKRRSLRTFSVPQLVGPGEIAPRPMLPSFLYLPGAHDLPPESMALPWDEARSYVVGAFARDQGARVPGRLVASAKSWLCYAKVDRTAPILPWGSQGDLPRISPVTASTCILQHLREAWDHSMAAAEEENRVDEQLVVLTVPASFDEVARELTVQAAQAAAIAHPILLEEPLAAFYAWLSHHEADWQGMMRDGQLILICDVGGGTTDFSLVGVREGKTGLRFDRLAVGEHLLLGGDNMDLALARLVESRLLGRPGALDAARWHQLVHQCRLAKEALLSGDGRAESYPIAVLGGSGQLIGGTLRTDLTRAEVERTVLEGFLPTVPLEQAPAAARRTGLTELGLPYVQDPAITRHLAHFWRRFQALLQTESGRQAPYPDYLLFNGGALIPPALRQRLRAQVADWFQPVAGRGWQPTELENPHPESAVALGAAYYGLVRLGKGVRVGAGSPRTYYVAVGAGDGAAQGETRTAVCLVPRGTDEGFAAQLEEMEFSARTNQPVVFQILASSTRTGDRLGSVVELAADEMAELPPIRTVLRYGRRATAQQLPVQIGVRLTAIGTLELWCQSLQSDHRWQLQFDVRQEAEPVPASSLEETVDQARIERAQAAIEVAYGSDGGAGQAPESLRRVLEETLEMAKESWPTALVRTLADTLLEHASGRTRSAEHEARWLNLLGYCLRPGYGAPVDDWRLQRVWRLYFDGLHFPRQNQGRIEWWVFWRRVAGGLKAGQQVEIYQPLRPYLVPAYRRSSKKPSPMYPKHLSGGELSEIWMAVANFEWLTAAMKVELGRAFLESWGEDTPKAQELWVLSRLGARLPLYGPLDRLVPAEEAAAWVERLLARRLPPGDGGARLLVALARYTGDRGRDLPPEQRSRVEGWLARLSNPERYLEQLHNPQSGGDAEQAWAFGESLPAGLQLISH